MSKALAKVFRRQHNWNRALTPPPRCREYAYPVAKDLLGFTAARAGLLDGGVDETTMSATAVITTEDRDRVGDEVVARGCDLSTYGRNPVVFFGHQSLPIPIGRAVGPDGRLAVEIRDRDIVSRCYFHQSTPEGLQFFTLVKDGVLNAVSIGFNPVTDPIPLTKQAGNAYAGFRFDRWELLEWSFCGVGANPYCQVVRGYLSRGQIGGERISMALRKSLQPLAEPRRAFLFTGDTSMSKKYGKGRPKRKMDESSGTEGGYAATNEEMVAKHCKNLAAIIGVAHKHLNDAHPDSPHGFHYHPTKMHVHHHHGLEEGAEHLGRVKSDLEAIPDVAEVHQHSEPPGEAGGYMHAFSRKGESEEEEHAEISEQGGDDKEASAPADRAEAEDEVAEEGGGKEASTDESWEEVEEEEEEQGKGKSVRYQIVKSSDLQECVSKKIPILIDEGYEQDQAAAIAYSMCRKKQCPVVASRRIKSTSEVIMRDGGALVLVQCRKGSPTVVHHVKAVTSHGSDKDDFEEQEHELEAGGKYKQVEDMPAGAACAHSVLDAIGEHMPLLEPERREFWEGMAADIREHHHDIYPDHGFLDEGEVEEAEDEDEEEYEEEAADEDEAEEEEADRLRDKYDAYAAGGLHRSSRRGRGARHEKRVHSRQIIGVVKSAADFMHDHSAAENLTHEQVRDVMYHHHALNNLHRDMSDAATNPIPTDSADDIPDTHKAQGLEKRLDDLGGLLFRVTGKKVEA